MADDVVQEGEEKQEIQSKIADAVRSRLQHFKDQSDSLTLGSVRRLLEKDLGLEKNSLDVHKRFIRQYLEKQMEDADDDYSKMMVENVEKDAYLNEKEVRESPKVQKTKKDPRASNGDDSDEETLKDSPVMGLLNSKSEMDNQGSEISESRIEKAIWDRADHFTSNSEKITLTGVRRLLEEDLGLDKNTLDPFKKLISEQIDQVLNSNCVSKNANHVKRKSSESSQSKTSKKISSETGSDSSDEESDKGKDKVKSRKKAAPRAKDKKSDGLKQHKRSNKHSDSDVPVKNQSMRAKRPKEDIDSDNDGSVSEDGQSQSSVGKRVKRKEQLTSGYGKQVDHLRSVIKSCGMSVAPTVYKKAKQVPESKRDAFLVKELEGILKREGLSSNPTEKEIKDCRKRKERAKELEGIDTSNIISSSRRRSTSSFMAPKSKVEPKGDKDDVKASKHKDNKDKDGNVSDEQEETKVDKDDAKAASKHKDNMDKDGNDGDEEEDKVEEDDEKVEEEDKEVGDEEEEEEEEEDGGDDDSGEEFNEDDGESD